MQNSTKNNDIKHENSQHNNKKYDTQEQHSVLLFWVSCTALFCCHFYCYGDYRYPYLGVVFLLQCWRCWTKCSSAKCCHFSECQYVECHFAECRGSNNFSMFRNFISFSKCYRHLPRQAHLWIDILNSILNNICLYVYTVLVVGWLSAACNIGAQHFWRVLCLPHISNFCHFGAWFYCRVVIIPSHFVILAPGSVAALLLKCHFCAIL